MRSIKFNNAYIVRLDKGEEIVAVLKEFCRAEKIKLGSVSGIGATNQATLGLFNVETKQYRPREFAGNFEIASLAGNITTMNGEVYLHLHAVLGDENQQTYGGHLTSAVISATGEIIITVFAGTAGREFDQAIGLNLLKL